MSSRHPGFELIASLSSVTVTVTGTVTGQQTHSKWREVSPFSLIRAIQESEHFLLRSPTTATIPVSLDVSLCANATR